MTTRPQPRLPQPTGRPPQTRCPQCSGGIKDGVYVRSPAVVEQPGDSGRWLCERCAIILARAALDAVADARREAAIATVIRSRTTG